MTAVLIQIDGYDPIAGEAVTLRAASVDDDRVCHLDANVWWPALVTLPALRYDLFDGAFGNAISAPQSSLVLATEVWPRFPLLSLADARIQLWTGDAGAGWTGFTLRFDGRVSAQPAIANGQATINFGVDDRWLDGSLLALYTGTTDAEGDAALKGQPKPLSIGAPRFAPGTLIDSVNNVVQVSGYGPIEAAEAAFERIVQFAAPMADYANYAALVAATIPAGAWATAKAVGMVRHGAPPAGKLSYHIKGDRGGADGWVRRPGAIIRRIAHLSDGAGRTHDASLTTLNAARPFNLSLYQGEQTTARELVQRIAASVNAVAGVSWLGKLFAIPIGYGTPALALDASGAALPPVASVEQLEVAAPFWKLAIGAVPTWGVHALSDVAFSATLIERGLFALAESYREGHVVSLSDGSRWLYTATAPSSGNAPGVGSAFWSVLSPAVVPVDGSGVPLSELIGAVRDLADGKTTTFFRASAPIAAESQENDLWINTALGNRLYRRVAGSGLLAIGGDRIQLQGGSIELCWGEAPDQRIGQALVDAAGAQATADGKVEAFAMMAAADPVPVGFGVGDILYRLYLSPSQIDRWSGSAWVPQATYGATADQAGSIAQSAAAITSILSDAVLSRAEKPAFVREWQRAQADYAALTAKAAGFAGAEDEIATLSAAYAALALAIAALSPPYADTDHDSAIPDPAALQVKWTAFFTAHAALLMAITAQTLVAQWSVDGATAWHTDYAYGDLYQRQSADGGATWSTPFKAVGEDGTGTPGQDGKFTSFVFKRSAAAPAAPTDATTPPAGWFDAPPAQTVPATALWQTSADFRGADRLTDWAAPKKLVPADLADLDPGAKDLLDQAKSIADGKNKQFYRDTPPRAADSQEGDTWFNTALGNRAYRRVAGTGLLAIGGDRITLGGGGIEQCWVEAPDQRIAMVVQDVAHTLGVAEGADAKADAAIDSILGLGDDSKLDPSEKIRVLIPRNAELEAAWAILDAQAGDFGITTQRAAAAGTRAAWASYRDGLSPAWDATGSETAIARATFRAKLGDYEAAIELLKRAISAEAARRAHWSAVVDDNGQLPEPGADVTANKQVSIVPPAQAIVTADYQGTFTAGQFPKVLTPQVARGGSSIRTTNETSYALASISAGGTGAVTVNNTNGSADKGRITITDAMTASFTFTLIITVNGVIQAPIPLAAIVERAPPPTGGGGSGGGTGNKSGTDSNFPWLSATTEIELSDVFTVDVASGETIRCYAALDYQYSGAAGSGNYVNARWRYRTSPSGSWIDVGSSVSGSNSGVPSNPGGGSPGLPTPIDPENPPAEPFPGGITCNQNKAGLSAGLYDVALFAQLAATGGGIGITAGTASINVSA